jgi:hypothetical protein
MLEALYILVIFAGGRAAGPKWNRSGTGDIDRQLAPASSTDRTPLGGYAQATSPPPAHA